MAENGRRSCEFSAFEKKISSRAKSPPFVSVDTARRRIRFFIGETVFHLFILAIPDPGDFSVEFSSRDGSRDKVVSRNKTSTFRVFPSPIPQREIQFCSQKAHVKTFARRFDVINPIFDDAGRNETAPSFPSLSPPPRVKFFSELPSEPNHQQQQHSTRNLIHD